VTTRVRPVSPPTVPFDPDDSGWLLIRLLDFPPQRSPPARPYPRHAVARNICKAAPSPYAGALTVYCISPVFAPSVCFGWANPFSTPLVILFLLAPASGSIAAFLPLRHLLSVCTSHTITPSIPPLPFSTPSAASICPSVLPPLTLYCSSIPRGVGKSVPCRIMFSTHSPPLPSRIFTTPTSPEICATHPHSRIVNLSIPSVWSSPTPCDLPRPPARWDQGC